MDHKATAGYREAVNGPYRATQLWNDVIQAFRDELPCGKHRRITKTFDNCFSGSSAIEWLYNYLKSSKNFTADLTREKAVSLVNKIYKAGVFAEVKVSKSMHHKPDVQENRLYRFLPVSPSKSKLTRLPLAPRNDVSVNQCQRQKSFVRSKDSEVKVVKAEQKSKEKALKTPKPKKTEPQTREEVEESYPPCYLITKILTPQEIKQTWERVFTHRLKKTLGMMYHTDLIQSEAMDGNCIMHNCVYVNKNGTVSNIAPEDQFPHWVWSAMKCLARWPEPQEVGLPNYPGFEKDVFTVVKDYFLGLQQPLIPFSLYNAITKVFVCVGSYFSPDVQERQSVVDSLWASASLENVIMNLAKKYNLLDGVEESCDHDVMTVGSPCHQVSDVFHERACNSVSKITFSQARDLVTGESVSDGDMLASRPPAARAPGRPLSSYDVKSRSKFASIKGRKFGSMPNLEVSKYETAFGPDNHTVTRVYYQNGVCTDYKHSEEELARDSYYPVETHFDVGLGGGVQNVNFERVKSMENLHPCVASHKDRLFGGHPSSFLRSKSFAGGEFPQSIEMRAQSQTDVNSCADDIHPRAHDSFHRQHCAMKSSISSQALWVERSGRDCAMKSNVSSQALLVERSRFFKYSGTSTPSIVTERGRHDSPKLPRSHSQLSVHGQNFLSNQGATIHLNQKNRPRRSESRRSANSYTDIRTREMTPCIDVPRSVRPTASMCPFEDAGFGPGYRPVLDASKERRSNGSEKVSASRAAPHVHRSFPRQVTSTPLSPSCLKRQSWNLGSQRSLVSLSDVTPLYETRGRANFGIRDYEYVAYPQTRLSEDRAKAYLQLVTLLIPPASRRKLQMLFKMMTKMTANPNLCLDPTQSTRSLVLGTFYSAIVWPEREEDSDELLILQLVSFMLDFHDDIFTPPEDLKKQVNQQLKQLQRPQISFSPRPTISMQFCQQTSVTEYEQEKRSLSERAVEDLLEGIVKDPKMGAREKRHRLKQFQKTYPAIFSRRFPNPESEAMLRGTKPKVKDTFVTKPLNKLKGLRL